MAQALGPQKRAVKAVSGEGADEGDRLCGGDIRFDSTPSRQGLEGHLPLIS